MEQLSLEQIAIIAQNSKQNLWDMASSVSREPRIFLHWSAGHYGQAFNDYHINIDQDGSLYVSTEDLSTILEHTWHENTGAIGVSMLCCAFANTQDLGDPNRIMEMTQEELNEQTIPYEPPTEQQIEVMAQVIAILCTQLEIPCTSDYVITHAEIANIDGYGLGSGDPEVRWDLSILHNGDQMGSGGDIIREKAIYYQQNMEG